MDSPPRNVSVSGSNSLMGLSVQCLAQRDFLGCRNYAFKAQESDPNVAGASQVLAVADVLHAAERRLKNDRLDYYSILQLSRTESANRQLVWTQFMKLVTLVNPKRNEFAFSDEAFNLLREAWALLSDPEKKTQYDIEVGAGPELQENGSVEKKKSETFWTVCPYCYCMFEYGKVYEGCCLRCQTCRRGFHGVAIRAPAPEIMVPGKGQYHFCYGVFPLGYSDENVKNDNKERCRFDNVGVVEISDDEELEETSGRKQRKKSDDSASFDSKNDDGHFGVDGFCSEEEEVKGNGVEGICKGESFNVENEKMGLRINVGKWPKKAVKAPARRMKNVKSVALNTKKIVGNWMRNQRSELMEENDNEDDAIAMGVGGLEVNVHKGKRIMNEAGDGNEGDQHEYYDGGLVFLDGEDDVFVGLVD